MAIDISTDKSGTALRMLVYQALAGYSTEALLPFLGDSDTIVRTAAARKLQVRGGVEVFEHAAQLATSTKKEDREISAFILGQLGTPKRPFRIASLPILKKLCMDKSSAVREAALASLGHLDAVEAIDLIKQLKRDRIESVQKMARYAERQLRISKSVGKK